MSKFRVSLKEKPKVIIEFTEDLKESFKPKLEQLFGVAFLASETKKGDLLYYEFIPDTNDFELIENAMKKMYEERIVKEIDINIDYN